MDNYQNNKSPGEGYAIASMVLGICGIVFCFGSGILGIICSIIALVMHHKAIEADGFESSYSKAGKVCGTVGLALGIVRLLLVILTVIVGIGANLFVWKKFM